MVFDLCGENVSVLGISPSISGLDELVQRMIRSYCVRVCLGFESGFVVCVM